jgi:hypothetical protein
VLSRHSHCTSAACARAVGFRPPCFPFAFAFAIRSRWRSSITRAEWFGIAREKIRYQESLYYRCGYLYQVAG